jgi:hypothetical protein
MKDTFKKPILLMVDLEPFEHFINPDGACSLAGLEESISFFRSIRPTLSQATGNSACFSWSVRMDEQILHSYGDRAHMVRAIRPQLDRLVGEGDTVGLHVHSYRPITQAPYWIEDLGNQVWVNGCIDRAYEAFCEEFGYAPETFSTGSDWTSEGTIRHLSALGIKVDSTVVASCSPTPFPSNGGYTGERVDCSRVAVGVYHPAIDDFRVAGTNRDTGLWLLPQTRTRPTRFGRTLAAQFGLTNASRKRPAVPKMYLHESYEEFRWQVKSLLSADAPPYLTLILASRSLCYPERITKIERNLKWLTRYKDASRLFLTTLDGYIDSLRNTSEGSSAKLEEEY